MSLANALSLLKLDILLFHVKDDTAKEESSTYLFSQNFVCMFLGRMNFMLLGKFSWHFGGKWGLYLGGIDFICVPGSPLSWSSDFLFFRMCSTSWSSEEAGAEVCMLPKGNSTSHSLGLATKAMAAVLVSSSRLGICLSNVAISATVNNH